MSPKRRNGLYRHHRPPVGASPGTLRIDPEAPKPVIDVITYHAGDLRRHDQAAIGQLSKLIGSEGVNWINVSGLGDEQILSQIGKMFNLHPLALADVVHVTQRPKIEGYPQHIFGTMRMVRIHEEVVQSEQLSIFLVGNTVLTFQERPGDCFDPVRRRLVTASGRIRSRKADYLFYALIDAVIDSYYPVLEQFGERIESLEDLVMTHPDHHTLAQVRQCRRRLLEVRRVLWPLRDAVNTLLRDPMPQIADETRVFLRDCSDHVSQLIDTNETLRELAAGLQEVYLSTLSNRMNRTMQVLTTIATIFIPLTFIVGIYGMNFDPEVSPWNMPELGWYWGYPAVMLLMALIAGSMLVMFRMTGMLGHRRKRP